MKKLLLSILISFTINSVSSQNRDTTFNTTATAFSQVTTDIEVTASVLQPDGKIVAVGNFSIYNGVNVGRLVRINTDGSIDASFTTNNGVGFNYAAQDVTLQSDGKILIAMYTSATNHTFNGVSIKKLIRLNANGTLDTSFNYYQSVTTIFNPEKIALQSDGKIVIGHMSGQVTRLNSNGTLDSTFAAGTGFSGTGFPVITSLKIDVNGKIVVGGCFTTFNGSPTNKLARLNINGSLDSTLNTGTGFAGPTASAGITCIDFQTDGKIVVGGNITSYNGNIINRVARINSNGDYDSSFSFSETIFNSKVSAIKIQNDGQILIAGSSNTNLTTGISFVRVNPSGTNDNTLNISSNFFGFLIISIHIQTDNKIILAGNFINYNTYAVNRIFRMTNPVLSSSDFSQNRIVVYPNPVATYLNLQDIEDNSTFTIFDLLGKQVLAGNLTQKTINVEALKQGLYLLKVKSNNQETQTKFIKE